MEPINDFPPGFSQHTTLAAIELHDLMRDPHDYRTHLEGAVDGLREIARSAADQPPTLFPHQISALRLADDVYTKWRECESAQVASVAVGRTLEMAHYLEAAVYLVMEADEYRSRMRLAMILMQLVSMYSGPCIRY